MKTLQEFKEQEFVLTEEQLAYLEEKLLLINNGAKYGQVVFLAGGAGSGKGFASSNFMESEKFKVRDVDEWKRIAIELSKFSKNFSVKGIVDKYGAKISDKDMAKVKANVIDKGLELKDLDLRNPSHVFALHIFVDAVGIKNKTLGLLLSDLKTGRLPNIMFDITAKDVKSIDKVLPMLKTAGYNPRDIHLVWVLTDYRIAVQNNAGRARVVPEDILLKTHEGAANTVYSIVTKGGFNSNYFNGGIYVILNNRENTIFYTDKSGEKIKSTGKKKSLTIKDFTYLTVKKPGGKITSEKSVLEQLFKWIVNNIPKTKATQDIFGKHGTLEDK